jgi:hypothetical protein
MRYCLPAAEWEAASVNRVDWPGQEQDESVPAAARPLPGQVAAMLRHLQMSTQSPGREAWSRARPPHLGWFTHRTACQSQGRWPDSGNGRVWEGARGNAGRRKPRNVARLGRGRLVRPAGEPARRGVVGNRHAGFGHSLRKTQMYRASTKRRPTDTGTGASGGFPRDCQIPSAAVKLQYRRHMNQVFESRLRRS